MPFLSFPDSGWECHLEALPDIINKRQSLKTAFLVTDKERGFCEF
jgi:hypothetical protein